MLDSNYYEELNYNGGKFLSISEEVELENRRNQVIDELYQGRKLETRGHSFSLFEDIDQVDDIYIGELVDNDVNVWNEFVNGRLPKKSLIEVAKHVEYLANRYMEHYIP